MIMMIIITIIIITIILINLTATVIYDRDQTMILSCHRSVLSLS